MVVHFKVIRLSFPEKSILRLFQVFFDKSDEKVSLRLTGVVCGYLLRS